MARRGATLIRSSSCFYAGDVIVTELSLLDKRNLELSVIILCVVVVLLLSTIIVFRWIFAHEVELRRIDGG